MRPWAGGVLLGRRWGWGCSTEEGTEARRWGQHLPHSPLQQLGIHGGKRTANKSRDSCELAGRHPSRRQLCSSQKLCSLEGAEDRRNTRRERVTQQGRVRDTAELVWGRPLTVGSRIAWWHRGPDMDRLRTQDLLAEAGYSHLLRWGAYGDGSNRRAPDDR